MRRQPRLLALAACAAAALMACATPSQRYEAHGRRLGFSSAVVRGTHFHHRVYHRPGRSGGAPLHVYLEGDASPREASRWIPPDPTPRPLALRLLALDPAPGVLLGRPCAHRAGSCEPRHFTLERFSGEIVASLVAAARTVMAQHGATSVVLLGHSGGGALAMLMAERMPEARAVVTVAGNLDLEAWTAHHGYHALQGSLDPARRPPLDPSVVQIHLVGGRDRRVPPALTQAAIARQPGARRRLVPEFDHRCCWDRVWGTVLQDLRQALGAGATR